ncbi:MAG: hypothetical protein D6729_17180 [Deltaproteobacteria bacterium]|nr:MAG: hypothetical protein D6729_17180 [Deltaproteobacteria bacterium]
MWKRRARLILVSLLLGLFLGGAFTAWARSALLRRPRRQWVVFLEPGMQYDYGRSYSRQPGMKESLAYWRKLAEERKILLAGQLREKKGAMIVVPAETPKRAVEAMARKDPAVVAQVVRYEIDEWLVNLEAPPPPDPLDVEPGEDEAELGEEGP